MKKPDTEKLSGFFLYKKKMKIFIASKLYKICEIIGKIKKSFFFRGDLPYIFLSGLSPVGELDGAICLIGYHTASQPTTITVTKIKTMSCGWTLIG